MNSTTSLGLSRVRFALVGMLINCFAVFTFPATAQQSPQGQNGVYNSALPQGSVVPSPAFIDASMFASTTFCSTINNVFTSTNPIYPSTGAVIDARGLNSTNMNMTCATGWTPWYNPNTGSYANVPSTILLPAGTIYITKSWVLPNGTRVIGEGSMNPYNTTPIFPQTVIEACTPSTCNSQSFSDNTMIQFGSLSLCPYPCIGVTLEDVTLNGSGLGIGGIVNSYAQELSYAKNVAIFLVLGTGLQISGNAKNSGPYTNITYDTGNSGVSGSTCAAITNVSGGTRGIHGLTCTSDNSSQVAITLDSSNNSLEDIRITGFNQGVLIGSSGLGTYGNVLKNVWGDTTLRGNSPPTVVEIAGNKQVNNVTDLVLAGISNGMPGTNTIWDQETSTKLMDPAVAMYALGEQAANSNNAYSRFTTSPSISTNNAAWVVGCGSPPTSSGSCAKGSLYSCTGCNSSSCSASLYACAGTNNTWTPVPTQ